MGDLAPWMRALFYALMAASLSTAVWQLRARARLWQQGRPGERERDWHVWLRRLIVFALGQKRVRRRSLGSSLHLLLFSGFLVLTIGTTLLALSEISPVHFHRGRYYLGYEAVMDFYGLLFV